MSQKTMLDLHCYVKYRITQKRKNMRSDLATFFNNVEELKKDEAGLLKGGFTTLGITSSLGVTSGNVNVDVTGAACACKCDDVDHPIILKPVEV